MKITAEYLEEAIQTKGSAYKLAKETGLTEQAISHYRNGRRIMDDYACTRVAEILGIDPMEVITAANLEREKKNEERRRFWENFSKRMGWAAVVFLLVTSMGYGGYGKDNVSAKIYIMRTNGRCHSRSGVGCF